MDDDSDFDPTITTKPLPPSHLTLSLQVLGVTNVPPFQHEKPMYIALSGGVFAPNGDLALTNSLACKMGSLAVGINLDGSEWQSGVPDAMSGRCFAVVVLRFSRQNLGVQI